MIDKRAASAAHAVADVFDGATIMIGGFGEAGSPIELQYDYEAIRWLQENVPGTPVIAEAKVGYYREGGMRVAAYTGLPSVLGGLHQNEQRYSSQVGERDFVVNEFWNTPDPARARPLDLRARPGLRPQFRRERCRWRRQEAERPRGC